MAAIPLATHTAREVHRNLNKSYRQKQEEEMRFNMADDDEFSAKTYTIPFAKLTPEYHNKETPVKYNSKLMNSIWGLYNRYSVHNMKKIIADSDVEKAKGTQSSVTACPAAMGSVEMLLYGPLSLGTFWNKVSGTHAH